jgi:putative DNA primase/helicase
VDRNRSGILNWLVEGALLYLTEGFKVPKAITEATNKSREEMDPVGGFLRDCVKTYPKDDAAARETPPYVTSKEMYDAYVAWCVANSVRPWKQKAFGQAMSQKGFVRDRKTATRRYLFVSLHDVPAMARGHRNEPPHPADAADGEVP